MVKRRKMKLTGRLQRLEIVMDNGNQEDGGEEVSDFQVWCAAVLCRDRVQVWCSCVKRV